MYALGQGVPEDYVKAYMWLSLAMLRGSDADTRNKAVNNRMKQPPC